MSLSGWKLSDHTSQKIVMVVMMCKVCIPVASSLTAKNMMSLARVAFTLVVVFKLNLRGTNTTSLLDQDRAPRRDVAPADMQWLAEIGGLPNECCL